MPYKDPEVRRIKAREYGKKWYQKNKITHKLNAYKNRKKYKKQWDEFKASQKCSHCGMQHPAVIDFHHVVRSKDNQRMRWEVNSRCQ